MKKEYIAPQVEVIEMKCEAKLAYTSGSLGAPEFNPEGDFDWVEKGHQFGGWDLEEG